MIHPYYPAQLTPLGVTLATEHGTPVVTAVIQNAGQVTLRTTDGDRHYSFDQCVYVVKRHDGRGA